MKQITRWGGSVSLSNSRSDEAPGGLEGPEHLLQLVHGDELDAAKPHLA